MATTTVTAQDVVRAPTLTERALRRPARSLWSDAWRQFRRHRLAMAGVVVFGLLLVWLGFEFFLAPTLITQYRGVPTAISPYLTSLGLLVEFAACAFGILFFYGLLTHRRASVRDPRPALERMRSSVFSGRSPAGGLPLYMSPQEERRLTTTCKPLRT